MLNKCPGAAGLRGTPTITEKVCPQCGNIIEIFSIDAHVVCECGFVAYNDTQNCIKWCAYASECVGEEIYDRFMEMEGK
jgi:hypothetical protein